METLTPFLKAVRRNHKTLFVGVHVRGQSQPARGGGSLMCITYLLASDDINSIFTRMMATFQYEDRCFYSIWSNNGVALGMAAANTLLLGKMLVVQGWRTFFPSRAISRAILNPINAMTGSASLWRGVSCLVRVLCVTCKH